MSVRRLKKIFYGFFSDIKTYILGGTLSALGFYSHPENVLHSLKNALQSTIQLWEGIALSLFVLLLISVPALIANYKNKSLLDDLKIAKSTLDSNNNNSDPFIRSERKARIQKWRDEISLCNMDIQKFYETASFIELNHLLTKEESNLISRLNSNGNSVSIIVGAPSTIYVPSNEIINCYQRTINRIEKEWYLI